MPTTKDFVVALTPYVLGIILMLMGIGAFATLLYYAPKLGAAETKVDSLELELMETKNMLESERLKPDTKDEMKACLVYCGDVQGCLVYDETRCQHGISCIRVDVDGKLIKVLCVNKGLPEKQHQDIEATGEFQKSFFWQPQIQSERETK